MVKSHLEHVDRQRWLIDNMLIMPKHEAWLHRDVSIQRAAGTTRIEGASLDEEDVRRLDRAAPARKLSEDERANVNALRAYEFIDFLSDQADVPVDELVIRELNRYFIDGAPELHTPGVYRKGPNKVGDYAPADQGDVPALMRSFALWFRDQDDTHPIVKAGIAHIHLIAIHPFWDGNGRTARGISTLLLQRSPFGFRKLLSLESFFFGARDRYFTAIERTLGAHFVPGYDATPWLESFVTAIQAHADWLIEQLRDWHRMMQDLQESGAEVGLMERQVDGQMFANRTGQITRSDYIDVTGVSPITASRDLAKLVELGFLEPEGKTRSRIYRPAQQKSAEKTVPEEQLPLLT